MTNTNNNSNFTGRLAADPRVFDNKDGSKKVLFTLYADRNRRNAAGDVISDQVSVEALVSAKTDGLGPYGYAHKGDLVAVATHVECVPYVKDGKKVFPPMSLMIDDITFLEPRSVTQARLAKRAVTEGETINPAVAAAAANVPAQPEQAPVGATVGGGNYENEAPFGA